MAGLPSVFSRAWLALCLAERGEFGEALAYRPGGARIAETGDPGFQPRRRVRRPRERVGVTKGDFARAVAVLDRGLRTDPGEPIGRAWPFLASALGTAWIGLGRLDDALPLLEQAVERAVAMKLMANHPLRLVRLAEAHLVARATRERVPACRQGDRPRPGTARARARSVCAQAPRRRVGDAG